MLVSGKLDSGDVIDVTRMVEKKLTAEIAKVSKTGVVRPQVDGQASLQLSLEAQTVTVPVTVSGMAENYQVDFVRDVNPVLSRLGCNQGTCHGSAKGKNGFKLSLRGYDALFDVRALTDDLASRRVNLASPDNSLMLLKADRGRAARRRPADQCRASRTTRSSATGSPAGPSSTVDAARDRHRIVPQEPDRPADRRASSSFGSWRPTPTATSAT